MFQHTYNSGLIKFQCISCLSEYIWTIIDGSNHDLDWRKQLEFGKTIWTMYHSGQLGEALHLGCESSSSSHNDFALYDEFKLQTKSFSYWIYHIMTLPCMMSSNFKLKASLIGFRISLLRHMHFYGTCPPIMCTHTTPDVSHIGSSLSQNFNTRIVHQSIGSSLRAKPTKVPSVCTSMQDVLKVCMPLRSNWLCKKFIWPNKELGKPIWHLKFIAAITHLH